MAIPTTKSTFKDYCLRALGYGVIDINISDDQADNDQDGLIDEKRDNDKGQMVGPLDGINDVDMFLEFYFFNIS